MIQSDLFTPYTKQQAMDLFEKTRIEFLNYARWWAQKIYKEKGNVSVDDIREKIAIPQGLDGRVLGAVFNRKDWKKVGYQSTRVKTSHARPVGIFVRNYENN